MITKMFKIVFTNKLNWIFPSLKKKNHKKKQINKSHSNRDNYTKESNYWHLQGTQLRRKFFANLNQNETELEFEQKNKLWEKKQISIKPYNYHLLTTSMDILVDLLVLVYSQLLMQLLLMIECNFLLI